MLKTKKSMKEYTQVTMMKYLNCGKCLTKECEEYDFFYDLAKNREDENRKIEKIKIIQNPLNSKTYHCEVVYNNETTEAIGFNKIIDNIGKTEETIKEQKNKLDLSQSMRKEIKDQIQEFRSNVDLICLNCKNTNCEFHIDHIIKFKKLQEDFFIKYPDIKIELEEDNINGGRKFKENSRISEKWKKYHKQNATLRILCKTCNLKLGSKDLY